MDEQVSVVVPVYEGERFLEEALRSVVDQDPAPAEVIVIDDGSTDRSGDIARSFGDPVRVIRQENAGPAAARNRGIAATTGDLVSFLDADDLWPVGSLARRLEVLRAHPDACGVMGRSEIFVRVRREDGAHDAQPFGDPTYGAFLSAMLLRRDALLATGGFREELRFAEDFDLLTKLREQGELVVIDDVTHRYRRHDTNMTTTADPADMTVAEVLKRSLDRRREAGGSARELSSLVYDGEGELDTGPRVRRLGWEDRL